MAEYYPLQFGALAGTDDGSGIAASASRLYGPWESEAAFLAFLREATEEQNPTIPVGTIAAFAKDGGGYEVKKWEQPIGSPGFWSTAPFKQRVIVIAGVRSKSESISLNTSTTLIGDETNIYYFEADDEEDFGVLGLSSDGLRYYPVWGNYSDFGTNESGNVLPFNGMLYVCPSTGQLFLSSDQELETAEGGLSPEDQRELDRLKALGIDLKGNTLYIGGQTFDLVNQGVSYTYGKPSVQLVYPAYISADGGNNIGFTSITITQVKTGSDGSQTTLTYNRLSELPTGTVVTFDLSDTDSGFEVTIDENTGMLSVPANTGGDEPMTKVAVKVENLNDADADSDWEKSSWIRQHTSVETLRITGVTWTTTDDGNGNYTATPTFQASNGQSYSKASYDALLHESYSFSCAKPFGATVNSTTGVVTYDMDDIVAGFSAGDVLLNGEITISVNQSSDGETPLSAVCTLDLSSIRTGTTNLNVCAGVRGGTGGGKLYRESDKGIACASQDTTSGHVYLFSLTHSGGSRIHIWESTNSIVGSDGSVNSSLDTAQTAAATGRNFSVVAGIANDDETIRYVENVTGVLIYKARNGSKKLTLSIHTGVSGDTIAFKDLSV